jgi:predicted nucleotidyltransferase
MHDNHSLLEDEEAIKKHKHLSENGLILFEAIVGSQSYGTALPTSDIDKKFIYIEPLENILSGNITTQINISKDYVGYEIARYMELLKTCNPNTIEITSTPEDCIVSVHPLFKKYFIDQREKFLTKQARFSFGNYAATQIKKAR